MVAHGAAPRIKISQELSKMTIPGRKNHLSPPWPRGQAIVGCVGFPATTPAPLRPQAGKPIMCLHPFEEQKRVVVTPSQVTCMHEVVWQDGRAAIQPTLEATRAYCRAQVGGIREDHVRFVNPTPYKVAVGPTSLPRGP